MKTVELETNYQSLFIAYVISGIQEVLARVRTAEPLPDEHDRQLAWHILSYAFNFDEAWPFTRELLLALAPKMEQAGFREDWIAYLDRAVEQAQLHKDLATEAECYFQIGCLCRLQSKFGMAEQWFVTSLALFKKLEDRHGAARTHNQLAYLAYLQRQYAEATRQADLALPSLGDSPLEMSYSFFVHGMVAFDQGDCQAAEVFHQKSLTLRQQAGDQRRAAWSLHNIGQALHGQGNFLAAIEYYQHALTIMGQTQDVFNGAVVQFSLGTSYYSLQQFVQAGECYGAAEQIFYKLQDSGYLARINTNQGLNYYAQAQWEAAESAFHASAELYATFNNLPWRLNALDGLAMTYLAQQQYEKAQVLLAQCLLDLPQIVNTANYKYLVESIHQHAEEARQGLLNQSNVLTHALN